MALRRRVRRSELRSALSEYHEPDAYYADYAVYLAVYECAADACVAATEPEVYVDGAYL